MEPLTFTYKIFENTDGTRTNIPLDVYLPSKRAGPITPVIWIHTGGFLQGTRKFVPPHLLRAAEKLGLALVTPDFRLCPQVSIHEVLEDVADSIRWTLNPNDRIASGFKADQLFTSDYILGGSSAGGWPALLLGLGLHSIAARLPSKPKAVFAIYAITTVTQNLAPFFHQAQKPLAWAVDGKLIDRKPLEDERHLQRCIDSRHNVIPGTEVLIKTEAPPSSAPVRSALYNFARQEGSYPSLILTDPAVASSVCTPSLIRDKAANASHELVPVFICYGDADEKVPPSQSQHVVEALQHVGYTDTQLQVHIETGGDHLFDMDADKTVSGLSRWLSCHI